MVIIFFVYIFYSYKHNIYIYIYILHHLFFSITFAFLNNNNLKISAIGVSHAYIIFKSVRDKYLCAYSQINTYPPSPQFLHSGPVLDYSQNTCIGTNKNKGERVYRLNTEGQRRRCADTGSDRLAQ